MKPARFSHTAPLPIRERSRAAAGYGAGALFAIVVAAALSGATPAQAQINSDPGMMRGDQPGSGQSMVPQQREKQFPVGSSWAAVSLNNKTYAIDGSRPYFTLDNQFQLRGFGGCNTFSATAYPLRGQGFAVSPFAMTRKSCGAQIDAAERAFMLALRMSQKWDVVKGQLLLQGSAGTLRADRSL
ncbi:META domain-containing protein [Pseudochelatococcus lubricantis]|uniref:META domain-containing protein n=1 Tax=Pseudochelatococcus lubricantis TaxID=1538102 RepID=UPI0035EBEE82